MNILLQGNHGHPGRARYPHRGHVGSAKVARDTFRIRFQHVIHTRMPRGLKKTYHHRAYIYIYLWGGERKPARDTFYTRHLLHQTPFKPKTFYTRHLLHQLHHKSFYTRHLLHQTPFTPNTLYIYRLLHHTFHTKHLLHQAPFTLPQAGRPRWIRASDPNAPYQNCLVVQTAARHSKPAP